MKETWREKFEKWAMAAAYATSGDHETAMQIMGYRKKRAREVARKGVRKERRAELRAD